MSPVPKKPKNNKKQEELEQQVGELTADLQRIQADFVNFKRRAEEDQIRAVAIGREGTLKALLPTVDNIEKVIVHTPADLKDHDYIKAIVAVSKKMSSDLEAMGLTRIETIDQEFDPEQMEAVSMDDSEGDKEVVLEELQSGYKLNGEVIRPAMVKVGRM